MASGSTVSYTFNNCDGGYGLTSINGSVKLELADSNGQLTLTATSTDLMVGGNPFILDMSGTATATGTQRTVTVTSHSRAPGQTDSRDVQFTMTWDQGTGCATLNGSGSSARGDRTTTSTITDTERYWKTNQWVGLKIFFPTRDGLNSTIIIYGDSLRPYGLGSLLIVLTLGAMWSLLQKPTAWRGLLTAATAPVEYCDRAGIAAFRDPEKRKGTAWPTAVRSASRRRRRSPPRG